MSFSYHRTVTFVSLWLLLSGCESDAHKLERLRSGQATKCLESNILQKALMTGPVSDSLRDQSRAAETECLLATRDLSRFLR